MNVQITSVPQNVKITSVPTGAPSPTPQPNQLNGFETMDSWLSKPAVDTSALTPATAIPGALANAGKSLLKFGVGAVEAANPMNIPKAIGAIADTFKTTMSANESKANADAMTKQLEADIVARKSAGQDTTHSEKALASIKSGSQGGISAGDIISSLGKGALNAVSSPAIQKATSGDFEGALKSVAEDPYQLTPYFLMLKSAVRPTETVPGENGAAPTVKPGGVIGDTIVGRTIDKGVSTAASPVIKGASAVADTVSNALEASRGARAVSDAKAVDNLVGTITQGKIADIPAAKRALSNIDITGLKTYQDLKSVLNDKIKNISGKLDETLSTDTQTKPLSQLTLESRVGESTVSHNYVQDALSQLKELYTKTNDPVELEKINQLEKRAETDGLRVRDVNDLARSYGNEFSQKAFSKTGDPLTSVNAQSLENTRSGLKSTAREMFGNKVFNAADSEVTALIKTRDLADQVSEKVNALQQKITERGFGEKAGRLVGRVADLFTGHALKGIFEYFTRRGEGTKVLNAIDMQKNLRSNLSALTKILSEDLPEADVITQMQDLIDQSKN